MTPASIVLVASLPALVTPAVAVTNLKTDNTAVLEIDDETLTAKSFAPAAKSWGVDCNCAIERGKIVDLSWPANGKAVAHWHTVPMARRDAANPSTS